MHTNAQSFHQRITFAGSLIAIGIVFGDIGTSPLYTLNAVFHHRLITENVALGSLSCIFWTLFFQTTLKYVIITLQADNKGEGGILSLYTLVRRFGKERLLMLAMAGAAFLIADGIITPPISVASAIEGLQKVKPDLDTVPIVIAILIGLFVFQQFGTEKLGNIFGPLMIIWFGFIALIGTMALADNWSVLRALNPYYAYELLVYEPKGFWLLGSIFLCTTGAEALYSDMGHCGRNNIRVSWIFVKICLVLCYAGQTAWLVSNTGQQVGIVSPFFHIVPGNLYWFAIGISTLATIIASQALISGCFSLINEAIRLEIWPKHLVEFPSRLRGQLYIPAINWFLMVGCVAMVLYFKESSKMEAAFGLSVTLTMIMSTLLLSVYLKVKRVPTFVIILIISTFLAIEIGFLVANLKKVEEGGWVTLLIGVVLFSIMYVWHFGKKIKLRLAQWVSLEKQIPILQKLSNDTAIQKTSNNLIYLTKSNSPKEVEKTIIHSILNTGVPKRADAYWFVHIEVTDEPFELTYSVKTLAKNDVYFINFHFGFKVEPRIGYYFKQVINELIAAQEVDYTDSSGIDYVIDNMGDYKFVVQESFLSYDNDMPFFNSLIMKSYYNLKFIALKDYINFGIDKSQIIIENVPLVVNTHRSATLKRLI